MRGARRFGGRATVARTMTVQIAPGTHAPKHPFPAATGGRTRRDAVHASCSPIL